MPAILAEDASERMGKIQTRGKTDALLRGLLYGSDGEKYYITFSKTPSDKKYRSYTPKADRRYGGGSSATDMIPGVVADASEIAQRADGVTRVREVLRLVILDPSITQAILEGRQPRTLSLESLVRQSLPWIGSASVEWHWRQVDRRYISAPLEGQISLFLCCSQNA